MDIRDRKPPRRAAALQVAGVVAEPQQAEAGAAAATPHSALCPVRAAAQGSPEGLEALALPEKS